MNRLPRLTRWVVSLALFFFVLMFLCRLAVFFAFAPPGSHFSGVLPAFWLGFRFDAREVGILCLLVLLIGSIPALHPFSTKIGKRISLLLAVTLLVWALFFYVFDFLHFRYLLQRLNASALSFLSDAKISGSMVWQTYPVIRILLSLLCCFLLLWWLLRIVYRRVARTEYHGNKAGRISMGVVVFLFCAVAIFGRVGQYPLRWSDAFDLGSDFNANLALNPFQSFFSSLSFRKSSFDAQKVKANYQLMAGYLGIAKPDSSMLVFNRSVVADSSATPGPNIVFVICESFSAYKSSMWGNPLNTTPYFNQLCKEGLFFDNCFTPSFGTARGIWASVTGVPDVEPNKTASRNPAMVDQHTIISDFDGYNKYYFLGGSASWANIRGLLTNNIPGLHLYQEQDYTSSKVDVWGISDRNLFKEANAVLGRDRQPFFAVIQTADNHRPYTIPAEDLKEFRKLALPADTLKKYGFENNDELNAFRFTDFCFQSYIEAARKQAYFNNTIFVFIGDHGISGNAGKMFPPAWSDDGLTRNHVPLLFYAPGRIAPQRLHCVASQLDVLPTLAGIAHQSYHNSAMGRDLLQQYRADSGRSNLAFIYDANNRDVGVINGDWYYTRNQQGSQEKLRWADFESEEPASVNRDSLLGVNRRYTTALYETARYLLLNNKKKP
ncbi:MAG: sulfatase-like hydrolase/transferase [Bacteroidota bacterium]|nr:sulfatase-like hydrolase/transferase [Bacteroidota bacterium]